MFYQKLVFLFKQDVDFLSVFLFQNLHSSHVFIINKADLLTMWVWLGMDHYFLEGGGLGNFLGYEFFSPLKVGHDCFLEDNSLLKDFFLL